MHADPAQKLIIFDVDGTLVDSQDFIVAAMDHAFAEAGHTAPSRDQTLGIVGLSLPQAMAALLPEADEGEWTRLAGLYSQSFVALRARTGGEAKAALYPGARACVERLHGLGYTLGLATGKARRGLDHFLHSHDLTAFFAVSQCADDAPSKPDPGMVLNCLSATGIAPGQAVMIGDTGFDITMGRAAGCRTIGVGWGYHDEDRIRQAGADHLVRDFTELDRTLGRLWGDA